MQEYIPVDQRIHLLCQMLAKANRNFVREIDDFSHTTLSFDVLGERISSRWIKTGKTDLILVLNLNRFSYQWLDASYEVLQEIKISGKTISELQDELEGGLNDLGLGPNGFVKKLKYQIPDYDFANDPFTSFNQSELEKWMHYRQMANDVGARFLKHLLKEDEIRIWPHHFDTGVYQEVNDKIGIGFGLAAQDSLVDSPYYYISGYPLHGNINFRDLPELKYGYWETNDWKGAVLPLKSIAQLDPAQKHDIVNDFMLTTCNWFMSQIQYLK
jgi:hypothetical protein